MENIMDEENYVLEWSKSQNCFHVQHIKVTISNNRRLLVSNKTHDYIVLAVGSYDEVSTQAETWRGLLRSRET
jgi:hypothetical protein